MTSLSISFMERFLEGLSNVRTTALRGDDTANLMPRESLALSVGKLWDDVWADELIFARDLELKKNSK